MMHLLCLMSVFRDLDLQLTYLIVIDRIHARQLKQLMNIQYNVMRCHLNLKNMFFSQNITKLLIPYLIPIEVKYFCNRQALLDSITLINLSISLLIGWQNITATITLFIFSYFNIYINARMVHGSFRFHKTLGICLWKRSFEHRSVRVIRIISWLVKLMVISL